MEEIFVVKLRHSSNPYSARPLPSEQRYSATLSLGLGIIHLILGSIAVFFACLAIFKENEVNRFGAGLWLGLIAMGDGLLGLVAWKKWYLNFPIVFFFMGSLLTLIIAVLCIVITIVGILQREHRLWKSENEHLLDSFVTNFNPQEEYKVQLFLTANILITSIIEVICCGLSLIFAIKGIKNPEHVPISSQPTLTIPKSNSNTGFHKHQVLSLHTNILIPDIFYRLPNRTLKRCHIPTNINPLWLSIPTRLGPDLPSLSTMGYEERVQAYLKEVNSDSVVEMEEPDVTERDSFVEDVFPSVVNSDDKTMVVAEKEEKQNPIEESETN